MKDKLVVITGASGGIGKECAIAFAASDATVAICSRTSKNIQKVRCEIEAAGGKAVAQTCDVGDEEQVRSFIKKAAEITGTIDVLINNAGIVYVDPVSSIDTAEWNETIRINLTGAFLTTRYSLPHMTEGSHIFNMISIAGKQGFPTWSAYCASKWGLLGFTNALREEVRSNGIRVTAVIPGPTDTSIWDGLPGKWDRTTMMKPNAIARSIIDIYNQPATTMIEEIVLMPQGGML